MKTYQLKPSAVTRPATLTRLPSLLRRLVALEKPEPGGPARPWVCIGADLEKAGACIAVQAGAEGVCAGGSFSRAEIVALVEELGARGWRVALGVEACGFGWVFQGRLRGAGATVFTFATESLTGRRKTNRRDAAALGQLVARRVVHGDAQGGRVVREPSPEEQQRRYLTRHRAQLVAHRGRVEAQGRGLLYDHGIEAVPECWWGRKTWPRLAALLEAAGGHWLRNALESQRELALALHAQVLALDAEVEAMAAALAATALANTPPPPHGLGELTALTLQVEVMDWHRFGNRKKAGRLPAPSGAALRAKAPPFGYLAPLDSSAAARANTARATAGRYWATSTGRATGACAARWSRPSGGCCGGTPAGAALRNGACCCGTKRAAACARKRPSSPV